MPRLTNISKYWVSRRSAALVSSNDGIMLTPCSGICWTPWTLTGSGRPRCLQYRRGDVDHVVELRTHLAAGLKAVRPVHDRAVAGAAPVRGYLLRPLIRCVHRMRPTHSVVVEGLGRAELLDPRRHELGRLQRCRPVQGHHLVESAVQCALGGGTVVADDVVDERVVEDL